MNTDVLGTAAALSALPSLGIGVFTASIDPEARAGVAAVVAFVVLTAAMALVLA